MATTPAAALGPRVHPHAPVAAVDQLVGAAIEATLHGALGARGMGEKAAEGGSVCVCGGGELRSEGVVRYSSIADALCVCGGGGAAGPVSYATRISYYVLRIKTTPPPPTSNLHRPPTPPPGGAPASVAGAARPASPPAAPARPPAPTPPRRKRCSRRAPRCPAHRPAHPRRSGGGNGGQCARCDGATQSPKSAAVNWNHLPRHRHSGTARCRGPPMPKRVLACSRTPFLPPSSSHCLRSAPPRPLPFHAPASSFRL